MKFGRNSTMEKLVVWNRHDNGLHRWQSVGQEIPTPPKELVGYWDKEDYRY